MFKPDKPTYLVLNAHKKISTMKKLKKAVMVSVASTFLLGAYVNIKEVCTLKPSGEFNIQHSMAVKVNKNDPNNYVAYSTFIYLFYDTGTTWTVPADWNNSNNLIECIGGGGSGGGGRFSSGKTSVIHGAAGGGGAYAYAANVTLTPGGTVSYKAGDFVLGGNRSSSTDTPAAGIDGNSSNFGAFVVAGGGKKGTNFSNNLKGGVGGVVITGTGFPGGAGKDGGSTTTTNYGGGAGGPHGAGITGGAGDAGFGGAGATSVGSTGGTGTNLGNGSGGSGGGGGRSGDGGLWGGGGGGGEPDQDGGAGCEGLVVISYTPISSTTTVVTTNVNPSSVNTPVTFTATITSNAASVTGNVSFKDNGTIIGNSAVTSGVATYTTSNLAIGTHPINATYNGDSNNFSSNSSSISQIVRYVGSPFKIFINYG